jgi:hypothetical protein
MYMSDLRYIHDPVLSSLKMEGIRLAFIVTADVWQSSAAVRYCVSTVTFRGLAIS